jgi:hypothetical protein
MKMTHKIENCVILFFFGQLLGKTDEVVIDVIDVIDAQS